MPYGGTIQTLIMRNNSLSTMFSVQNNVSPTLRLLDLSYNNITRIESKNLELIFAANLHLDLRYNKIHTVNLSKYGTRTIPNGRLLQVDLHFNPLNCDCDLFEFIKYLTNKGNSLTFKVDNLKCQGSRFVNGIPVQQVKINDLLCPVKSECPSECNECWRRPYDGTLILNCTNRALQYVPYLPNVQKMNLSQMELFLENNKLMLLPLGNTTGYKSVTILNIEGNNLTTIDSSHLPPHVVSLNIKRNLIHSLNAEDLLKSLKQLRVANLSKNQFQCDCDDMSFWRFIHNHSHIFVDYRNMTCMNNPSEPKHFLNFDESCPHRVHVSVITFAGISSLAFLAFALYYKYQEEIEVWFYAHKWLRWLVAQYEQSEAKYDAFLAFSPLDEHFVVTHLAPGLESCSPPYKLCIPSRDWLIGDCIPDQIVDAIDNSKRTIFVLSKSFVNSVWSKLEFKYSHQAGLSGFRNKVIIIMYEDIGNINNLDLSLKAYLKTQRYFKWSDKRFWNNLRFAMPHKEPAVRGHLLKDVELCCFIKK